MEIEYANVVCLVYAVDDHQSIEKVSFQVLDTLSILLFALVNM